MMSTNTITVSTPQCHECGMAAAEVPAAAWWAGVNPAEAICCEVPLGGV